MFLYEDESHIRHYQTLRSTWSLKGRQTQIPTYGHHAAVSLFGCVNIQNEEFLCMETNRCNATTFLTFVRYILAQYQEEHIVMILDNAKIHHAKLLKSFLKQNEPRLTLLFLPPYSPNLNAVERIWGWLKGSVIVNGFHATRKEIRKSAESFVDYVHAYPKKVLQGIGGLAMSKN
ncbi:IS630 family transposase [Bacillus sp. 165]|uniref:IS630 family transposase n=1 Tax=Bacillus sp. 165 TaxID=1529117 RepID=UPI001AD99B86|nr:IS630 family transposase [Bacillus sp. 165]